MREESKERIRMAKAAMAQKKSELANDNSFIQVEVCFVILFLSVLFVNPSLSVLLPVHGYLFFVSCSRNGYVLLP